jgi:polyferredoxin
VEKNLQYLKYVILAAIVILCFVGIFSKVQYISPWNSFSQITSRQFRFQGLAVSTVLFLIMLAGSGFKQRFFCRFFCPMGAVFALMPVLPTGRLTKEKEHCIKGCAACKNNCPVGIDVADDVRSGGECIECHKCVNICPKQNIHTGIQRVKGNEIGYVIGKAAMLYVLYLIVMKVW